MKAQNLQKKASGIFCGILSALFVSGYITTNKYIYRHYGISALEYALIFAMAGAIFALCSLLYQRHRIDSRQIKDNAMSLVALGAAGALAVGILTFGQQYTSAINTALLMTSTIVATAFFSHHFLNEHHSRSKYVWIVLLFIGLYIGVVGLHRFHFRSGDIIVLASIIFFGFGNSYSRVVMKRMSNPGLVPDIRLVIGGSLAALISTFALRNFSVILDILPLAVLAGLFYWLCMKFFARAVYLINANNTIVLNNAQVFSTSLAGVLILAEPYNYEKLIGSLIAITAIYFIAVRTND